MCWTGSSAGTFPRHPVDARRRSITGAVARPQYAHGGGSNRLLTSDEVSSSTRSLLGIDANRGRTPGENVGEIGTAVSNARDHLLSTRCLIELERVVAALLSDDANRRAPMVIEMVSALPCGRCNVVLADEV